MPQYSDGMEHPESFAPQSAPLRTALHLRDDRTLAVREVEVTEPAALEAQHAYAAELHERFGFSIPTPDEPQEGARFIAVLHDNTVVGYGGIRPVPTRLAAAEVKRMWVDGQWRGSGLGSALLRRLEEIAAADGYREVVLDTNGALSEAIRLYERAGYRRVRRYNDNPDVELFFAKDLVG